jgi:hypothetical protein
MLRSSHGFSFVLAAALVSGCPLYPSRCDDASDCAAGYACDADGKCVASDLAADAGLPDASTPERCDDAGTCPEGLVCDRYKRCVPAGDAGGASGAAAAGGDAG